MKKELDKKSHETRRIEPKFESRKREKWRQELEKLYSKFHSIQTIFGQFELIKCSKNKRKRQKHERSIKNW